MDKNIATSKYVIRLEAFSAKPHVDFSQVKLGGSVERVIVLENPSDRPCVAKLTMGSSGTFHVVQALQSDSGLLLIEPKSSTEVTINWVPQEIGHCVETLRVRASTLVGEVIVKLVGKCLAPTQHSRVNPADKISLNGRRRNVGRWNDPTSLKTTRSDGRNLVVSKPVLPRVQTPNCNSSQVARGRGLGALCRRDLTGSVVVTPRGVVTVARVGKAQRLCVKGRPVQCSARKSSFRHNKTFVIRNKLRKDLGLTVEGTQAVTATIPTTVSSSSELGSNVKTAQDIESFPRASSLQIDVSPISKVEPNSHSSAIESPGLTHPISEDEGFKDGSSIFSANNSSRSLHNERINPNSGPNNSTVMKEDCPFTNVEDMRQNIMEEIRSQFQAQLDMIRKELESLKPPGGKTEQCRSKKGQLVSQRSVGTWTEGLQSLPHGAPIKHYFEDHESSVALTLSDKSLGLDLPPTRISPIDSEPIPKVSDTVIVLNERCKKMMAKSKGLSR